MELELANMPPGTRLMTDDEKLEMLASLEQNQVDINN
jgi:hypothetical protein